MLQATLSESSPKIPVWIPFSVSSPLRARVLAMEVMMNELFKR
jgi:hypothetical protein